LVEHDFVVRHQRQRRFVDDRNIGQLFVRVAGIEHRNGRFIHRREAHAGVEVAGGERRGSHPAEAAAPRFGANEGLSAAMVFGRHRAGEIDRAAGDVGVNVDAAGEDDQAGSVDRAAGGDGAGEAAGVVDANVFDLAVDAVGRVIDFSASN